MWIDIHPWSLTADSFWKPSFSGSMLNFGAVIVDLFGVLKMLAQRLSGFTSACLKFGRRIAFKRKLEVFFLTTDIPFFRYAKKSESKLQPTSQTASKPPELTGGNSPELLSPPLQGIADFCRQPSASANSSLEKPSSAKDGTHPGSSNWKPGFFC